MDWLSKHWKVLAFLGSLIVGWTTLKNDSQMHGKELEKHAAALKQCHDFMIAQNEINKKIDKLDDKLDRALRRRDQ